MKRSSFRKIAGDVCAPKGFLAAGVASGIKKSGGKDLALIVSQVPCHSAGTFTTNAAKAAPVLFDLQIIRRQSIQGIVVNSGNANACTGAEGLRNARAMSRMTGEMVSKKGLSSSSENFLVCSTGRIGRQLPMHKIRQGISLAASRLSHTDRSAAEAIMTTDTFAKRIAIETIIARQPVRIGGIAKGAGMIQPGMSPSGNRPSLHATMLCFLTTDAAIERTTLQKCLDKAVGRSFNRITVDGDMSTNDTVLLLANGLAGNRRLHSRSLHLNRFQEALEHVALSLALMIVKDGEGISKVVTLKVSGAASASDAEQAIRAIGNSTLVKCSWCGEDPNWGRIFDAVGYSGARFRSSSASISYNGIPLVQKGLELTKNTKQIHRLVQKSSFSIECDLGLGKHQAILYTTDLTEKYVELNKGE